MTELDEIFSDALRKRASDIHFSWGRQIMYRVDGELIRGAGVFSPELMTAFLSMLTGPQAESFRKNGETWHVYRLEGEGSFRLNIFKENGRIAAAVRVLPLKAPSFDDLMIPEALRSLLQKRSGLILLGGSAGSGRTTTAAALIDEINRTLLRHIVTIESNIEYIHDDGYSIINQRQAGTDIEDHKGGIISALKEDTDIIVVSSVESSEEMDSILNAVESGALVIAEINARSAIHVLKSILNLYGPREEVWIRDRLSETVAGIMTQALIPLNGGGRRAVFEFLSATDAVKNLIRDGKYSQITALMSSDKRTGMKTLDESITELYAQGSISEEAAMAFSLDKRGFREKNVRI